jgi:hypothetical protein
MANFTQEEIDAAVKKFIRTDVRTTRDPLGPRDADQVFAEVIEFVSSGLVFDTNSIFYLIYLAKNRVNQDLNSALSVLEDLEQAINEVGRYTTKVTRTSLLSDAASALLEADRLISQKKTIASPQFARYENALDQFVEASLAPNIRNLVGSYPETYEVVRPPQAAQTAIKSDIISLRSYHTTILAEAEQLSVALTEFLAQNLPILAIQNSVKKVQTDLKSLQKEFDGSTEAEAIEMTRDAYLRITAGRSVITNLVTMRDPTTYRMRGSDSTADRAQAAVGSSNTPGQVTTSKSAPYKVVPGSSDQLSLKLDGTTIVPITLVPPDPAKIAGSNSDQSSFQITESTRAKLTSSLVDPYIVPAGPGNVFDVYVDGVGYRVTLTSGSRTAAEVAAEVMTATRIDGSPGVFSDVAEATFVAKTLGIQRNSYGQGSIVIGSQSVNSALGFTDNQTASGTTANNILRLMVDDELEVLATLTAGSRTAAQVASDITAAASTRILGGTVTLGTADGVTISSKKYGAQSRIQVKPDSDVHRAAMTVLGFIEGQSAHSTDLSLESLYSTLNAVSGIQPTRSSTLLASGVGGVATLSGSNYILQLPTGSIPSGFTINDVLFIKAGENAGYYHVSSFTSSPAAITVDRPFAAVSGDAAQNQSWELRRDLITIATTTTDLTSSLEVQSGTANGALGLTTGINRGTTSGVKVMEAGKALSFSRNSVVAGDLLNIPSASQRTITEVSQNGYQIEVTPEVSNNLTGQLYYIEGAAPKAYSIFIAGLLEWLADIGASVFKSDILDLERKLNPLLYNMHPTTGMVNDAMNSVLSLKGFYTDLQAVFDAYVVLRVSLVDSMLDMLLQKGMRRGHDLLLLGQFEDFFSVNRDTASYGGNMMEKMRKVVQNDVPASRGLDGGQDGSQLTASFEDIDYNRDYSDGDDEKAIAETDDIPEPDVDDQILSGV